jgi:Rieske 2Fe-2S family protein
MSFNSLKKPVKSIPFDWYYSSSIYQKEISKIFLNEWLYVCHIDSIKSSHFRTLQVDQKNIILIKNKINQLSVYYNSCIHRGSQLFESSEGAIKTPTIICPYHQWSYSIKDGSLLNTTSINIQSFNKKKYSLKKVNFYIWKGLIFINFDSKLNSN